MTREDFPEWIQNSWIPSDWIPFLIIVGAVASIHLLIAMFQVIHMWFLRKEAERIKEETRRRIEELETRRIEEELEKKRYNEWLDGL